MNNQISTATFPGILKAQGAEIARALPRHLSSERMTRIALTAFRRTPKLAQCDPMSVFAAVIQAAQLGLEPDMLGRSNLIPYGKECQFVPGWKGLVELMTRSGAATVWTGAVFSGDAFEFRLGDSPMCTHVPAGEYDPASMTHAYAVGRVNGAEIPVIEVWSNDRILKHRDRYNKVGKGHYSFKHWEMYARKVVLLQVLKYLPCSPELAQAVSLSDASDMGRQNLSIDDAIEGTWVPSEDESAPPIEQPKRKSEGNGGSANE